MDFTRNFDYLFFQINFTHHGFKIRVILGWWLKQPCCNLRIFYLYRICSNKLILIINLTIISLWTIDIEACIIKSHLWEHLLLHPLLTKWQILIIMLDRITTFRFVGCFIAHRMSLICWSDHLLRESFGRFWFLRCSFEVTRSLNRQSLIIHTRYPQILR